MKFNIKTLLIFIILWLVSGFGATYIDSWLNLSSQGEIFGWAVMILPALIFYLAYENWAKKAI